MTWVTGLAGGDTFLFTPDRGPNATAWNSAVDDTTSYVSRFQTINLGLASATFSSFNLSTIFYQLSVQDKTLNLYFAFPYRQSRQLAFTEVRYADAITPEAKTDNCHVVIEDKTGMLYQSLDLHSRECQQIQQQLMQTLHLSPRPLPKKSMHSPPVPQQ